MSWPWTAPPGVQLQCPCGSTIVAITGRLDKLVWDGSHTKRVECGYVALCAECRATFCTAGGRVWAWTAGKSHVIEDEMAKARDGVSPLVNAFSDLKQPPRMR